MQKEEKKRVSFLTAFGLFSLIVGISGVPGDIQTWIDWFQWILDTVNHDIARWIFVFVGLGLLVLIFYPPNLRRQILHRLKCGQVEGLFRFGNSLEASGWQCDGTMPKSKETHIPGIGVQTEIVSTDPSVIHNYVERLDPSARYVLIRGNFQHLRYEHPIIFAPYRTGVAFRVQVKMRNKAYSTDFLVTLLLSPNLFGRVEASDKWNVPVEPYLNSDRQVVVFVDAKRFVEEHYDMGKFEYLGIFGIQLEVVHAHLADIQFFGSSRWKDKFRTFFSRETLLPWHKAGWI